jgi:hypothetical protein
VLVLILLPQSSAVIISSRSDAGILRPSCGGGMREQGAPLISHWECISIVLLIFHHTLRGGGEGEAGKVMNLM